MANLSLAHLSSFLPNGGHKTPFVDSWTTKGCTPDTEARWHVYADGDKIENIMFKKIGGGFGVKCIRGTCFLYTYTYIGGGQHGDARGIKWPIELVKLANQDVYCIQLVVIPLITHFWEEKKTLIRFKFVPYKSWGHLQFQKLVVKVNTMCSTFIAGMTLQSDH